MFGSVGVGGGGTNGTCFRLYNTIEGGESRISGAMQLGRVVIVYDFFFFSY